MTQKTLFAPVILAALMFLISPISLAQGSLNVTLLANVDDYNNYMDCWGYVAPDGREYALLGTNNGTSIVDITDAPTVNEVGFISGSSSGWRDMKTYRDYGYSVNENGGGLQIIDLSDVPNSVSLAGTYSGFSTSHNIYIDTTEALLFAEGSSSDPVRIISLADPENPVELSTLGDECHDIFARDGLLYVSEGGDGTIGVYDYSNPSSPQHVETIPIPSSGYVHNTWLTDDGNYLMSTEETTGKTVKIWDITNLSNPSIEDTYLASSELAHNVHIEGDYAFISHYTDGLRILDISDPTDITEVGYYDTYPGGGGGFAGAWGTFPHFPSGKILISDMSTGLYVVEFDLGGGTGIDCSEVDRLQARCKPSDGTTLQARAVLTNSNHDGETMTLTVNGDDYVLTIGSFGFGSGVKMQIPNVTPGTYTVELTDPAGCADPVVFSCGTDGIVQGETDDWGFETDLREEQPAETALLGNYPNPFNPTTTISYTVATEGFISLKVYNTLGQEIATLVDEFQSAGTFNATWNGTNDFGSSVASGIYLYRLSAGNVVETGRMLYMK